MFARSNIIVRGYDLFILKGLEEQPFFSRLSVSMPERECYLFFAFDNKNDIVVSKDFAKDIFEIFMHIPLITRVETYTVGIADIYELFKKYIELKDFEVLGRLIENVLKYLDVNKIFSEFHYSQGWFIFSVNVKCYYRCLLELDEFEVGNDIFVKNGMDILDGQLKVYRKCDEVEQNVKVSYADKLFENGRYKQFEGYKLGIAESFDQRNVMLK